MRVDVNQDGSALTLWRVEYRLWDGDELECGAHSERILARTENAAAGELREQCSQDGRRCEILNVSAVDTVTGLASKDCQQYLNTELQERLEAALATVWDELKRQSNYMQQTRKAWFESCVLTNKAKPDG